MSGKKQKTLPKIKKKLKNFLTDESWKVAKKDALWLSLGSAASFCLAADPAQANYSYHTSHGSSTPHSNSYPHSNSSCGHLNQAHASGYNRGTHLSAANSVTQNVPSVNGHFSGSASTGHSSGYPRAGHSSQSAINHPLHCNGTGHSSHWSHGSSTTHSSY